MPAYGQYKDRDVLALTLHQSECEDAKRSPEHCNRGDIYLVADRQLHHLARYGYRLIQTSESPAVARPLNPSGPDKLRVYFA